MAKNRRIMKISLLMLTMVLILILLLGGKMNKNNTARFFDGVEIQYETKEQREVITEVLQDILTLETDALKKKEYPDYLRARAGQKEDKVQIEQVIYCYFVPDDSNKRLNEDFYQELKTKEVKAEITNLLRKMRESAWEE